VRGVVLNATRIAGIDDKDKDKAGQDKGKHNVFVLSKKRQRQKQTMCLYVLQDKTGLFIHAKLGPFHFH
jgi:hypothetical protein